MAVRASGCLKVLLGFILLPALAGVLFWLGSGVVRVTTHETVDAVIVDLVPSVDSDGDTVYAPVYEYTVDGRTYRYRSLVNLGGLLVPEIGDTRTLLYNPDDPGDARVHNLFLLIVLPAIVFAILALILIGILLAAVRRASRSQPPRDWIPPGAEPEPQWASPSPDDGNRETIIATFMGTEPSQMDESGRVRYRIKASAEIDDVIHRFVGDWLNEDPTVDLMQRGNRVQVRINPGDPSDYQIVYPV